MGKQSASFYLSEIIRWTFLSLQVSSWITNIRTWHKSSFWDSICNQNSDSGQTLILHHPYEICHPYEMLFASYGQVYFVWWGFTPTARSPTIQQSGWTKAHPYERIRKNLILQAQTKRVKLKKVIGDWHEDTYLSG